MPKTRSDYIREELEKNFDVSAQDVADRLAKKGHRVTTQHVYQIRSNMRIAERQVQEQKAVTLAASLATREENDTPLSVHILNALTANPEGLSADDLAAAILKAGYKSRAADFVSVLRQKCYDMVQKGSIVKNGTQYKLQSAALEKIAVAKVAAAAQKRADALAAESTEYSLLRQAVVDFAKAKGLDAPEGFPDKLIAQRREVLTAQEKYISLWETIAKAE